MASTPRTTEDISLLAALIGALPEPVIIVGASERVLGFNPPAKTLIPALRTGELLALTLRAPDVLDAMTRVRASGQPETVTWRERVPVERVFDVRVAPLQREVGEPLLVLALVDLTETRRVERMRADFVANASHELRTPLASLLGFIETLQGAAREDPKARDRFLAIMREQAQRMARLIDDLLSLSRIEQSLHVRPEAPVNLVAVVGHVADTLGPLANEHGVELVLSVPQEAIVSGDRDEIVRVVENLIENAIKYGTVGPGAGQNISIGVTIAGRNAQLFVRDKGPGIPPEHLPRLTERFYRVDPGQSRMKGGTGLGLAIVKHIVARHRGRLEFESRPGHGSCFAVTLPLHAQ
jgi:two-component system, OmpR family, phosphate regulon sensor histidine kinase PhoR